MNSAVLQDSNGKHLCGELQTGLGYPLTRADVREEVSQALAGSLEDILRQEFEKLQTRLQEKLRPLQQQELRAVLDEWWGQSERSPSCLTSGGHRGTTTTSTVASTVPRSPSPPSSPLTLPAAMNPFELATPMVSAVSSPITQPSTPMFPASSFPHYEGSRKDWRRSFVMNATKADRKIQYLHGSRCRETVEVDHVIEEAIKALEDGVKPHLVEDGLGGTYFVKDRNDKFIAVFKPRDEEPLAPNNPKEHAGSQVAEDVAAPTKGLKEGVLVGEAAMNEYAAFLVDQASGPALRAGVCPTALVRVANSAFHSATEDKRSAFRFIKDKVGSFQLFAEHSCSSEDMGAALFPADQVHRIAALDIRLCNTDRHSGNMLVQSGHGREVKALVPIDHGYALPGLHALGEATFEWLSWPAANLPWSEVMRKEIRAINPDEVERRLKSHAPTLRAECLATLRACTALLQHGVEAGLTARDIGLLMMRPEDEDRPSALEELVTESKQKAAGEDQIYLLEGLIAARCRSEASCRAEG
mmetsp:Transcript_47837/g.86248  ORF Transcript_47837/g.86248 Transcript_47837/m.86248 type:complete len:528 (+) Transcript_47837:82-1665(+)|eukprot:CAMPEP_0197626744 /NCGR_PEP_ID=MMETSP1338-20131121/5568_1 /TAXON_ID=43686 ORGANISM="Pelagodinium beii, Strain RCC1491" /NCGR_SAMPLE_ID=MMETSP1338 /ASSEMBLY_ACC=CAM_ASM_000754 /LENGTH=527 /DNA_ID=CAMNT_0043197299 /DNA_START=80 /DNA_END=1663 /DNA_ORIENTATION=+